MKPWLGIKMAINHFGACVFGIVFVNTVSYDSYNISSIIYICLFVVIRAAPQVKKHVGKF